MKFRNILIIVIFTCLSFAEEWVTNIYNNNAHAVVSIYTVKDDLQGIGTGFIIDKEGIVISNYHVLANKDNAVVQDFDENYFSIIDIIEINEEMDYIIMKIEGNNHPVVKLGNSDEVRVGDDVVAIGHPLGIQYSITRGIISQIRQEFFQFDASITFGNSGGPLFNKAGEVIGINSFKWGDVGGDLNFALAINYIKDILKKNNVTRSLITNRDGKTASSILLDLNATAPKQSQNYHQAKKQYLANLKLDPNSSTAYLDLGITLFHLKSNYEAIDYLDSSINLKPTSKAYYYRGLANGKLRKYNEMCADLRTASRHNHKQSDNLVKEYCN